MPDSISELERTSKQYRAALLTHDRGTMRLLTQRYGLVWANIKQRTDNLTAAIVDARAAGEEVKVSWLYQKNRLGILRLQVEEEILGFSRYAAIQISGGQSTATQLAEQHAEGLSRAQLGPPPPEVVQASIATQWTRLPTTAVESMVGYLQDGSPFAEIFATLGPEVSKGIGDALIVGVAIGQGPRAIAREIRNRTSLGLMKSLQYSRDAVLGSYREATHQSMQANSDVLRGWVRLSALGPRTCAACFALHGSIHPLSERLVDHSRGRCTAAPITRSWADLLGEKGKGIPETSIQVPKGADLFAKLTPEEQLQTLGPAKMKAFTDGAISLDDCVKWTDSPKWGRTPTEKGLTDILGEEKAALYKYPGRVIP